MNEDEIVDTDIELQKSFESGILKPGETYLEELPQRDFINNKKGLKDSYDKISQRKLLFPEILLYISDDVHPNNGDTQSGKDENQRRIKKEAVLVKDDFQRELYFFNQAQSSVQKGLNNLKIMGISTIRPNDYFAEMVKSDDHMEKIRKMLISKKEHLEKVEKIRHVREEKKFQKQALKTNAFQKKLFKKKELEKTKLWKKKSNKDLKDDFNSPSENRSRTKPHAGEKPWNKKKPNSKALYKSQKYGDSSNAGKKRGSKYNNIAADERRAIKENSTIKHRKSFGFKDGHNSKRVKNTKRQTKSKRPGKLKRNKAKSRLGNR